MRPLGFVPWMCRDITRFFPFLKRAPFNMEKARSLARHTVAVVTTPASFLSRNAIPIFLL